MNIRQFQHVLRAAAAISGETVFVVIGSQAVLAQYPNAPAGMKMSFEVDLYPKFRPDLAELIDGTIGAESAFHGTFGYHADGVGPTTARLPNDWESRAITLRSPDDRVEAICPEIHDLAVSKLLAGRVKDIEWIEAATEANLLDLAKVELLLSKASVGPEEVTLAKARVEAISTRGTKT